MSEAELRAGFVGAGFDLPDECFADIISVLDTDGDGAISLKARQPRLSRGRSP